MELPVHPRGHGEHKNSIVDIIRVYGSSPWARGTPVRLKAQQRARRFIPVGTGNTANKAPTKHLITVHPRGHGEHATSVICTNIRNRFIPVGTGNTLWLLGLHTWLAVHPRGHGEHWELSAHIVIPRGSSPWARGTLARV